MELSKRIIAEKKIPSSFNAPGISIFELPEKVLQFGTGVLLRGLIDFYIDKANKQNIFNGRVVVVKSTGKNVNNFNKQDCLYTHCIKGIADGKTVEDYIINAAVSKTISAQNNWDEILRYAESSDMQIIISNTTEVGIELKKDDDIHAAPPQSFPAKLLAFLYKRYKYFNGSAESGMVIIPTELIVDNGKKLKSVVLQLAQINKLNNSFIKWLDEANDFCSSLVDRIVPGSLKEKDQQVFEQQAGYKDALTIMSEPYSLWAIETSSDKTKQLLSFAIADASVIITENINKYRELKLRLLNATHTFCCGLAYIKGFDIVNQALHDEAFKKYIQQLMLNEIVPAIINETIAKDEAENFANNVSARFCNPFIEHQWLSISFNYTAKMQLRCVPLIVNYHTKTNNVAPCMCLGFAAYILFMRPVEVIDDVYYGKMHNRKYKIDDQQAKFFYELWQHNSADEAVRKILQNQTLWNTDLTKLPGFEKSVQLYVQHCSNNSFNDVIADL